MTDDRNQRFEGAPRSFRSIRRRSRPRPVGESPLDNIFSSADDPVREPPKPTGPAHVEAETRKLGHVKVLLGPDDCPDALRAMLQAKVANIGRFCRDALLFQAEFEGGEASLMACFTDVDGANKARIEGAVADALMATGYEDLPLGVLFMGSDSATLPRILRLAQDLKAE